MTAGHGETGCRTARSRRRHHRWPVSHPRSVGSASGARGSSTCTRPSRATTWSRCGRRPRVAAGRAGRVPRPQRLGQVDAADPVRRHPEAQRRTDLPRRRGDLPDERAPAHPDPLAQRQHHAPGRDPQPAALRHRPAEPPLRPALAQRRRAPRRHARRRAAAAGSASSSRPTRSSRRCPAASASASPWPARVTTSPQLLLADEPTSQLSHEDRDHVLDLIHALGDDFGTTILVVTHQPEVAGDVPAHRHHEGRPGRHGGPRGLRVRRRRRRRRRCTCRPTSPRSGRRARWSASSPRTRPLRAEPSARSSAPTGGPGVSSTVSLEDVTYVAGRTLLDDSR